ncbi:MAG: hypothetical protein V8S31_09275 [Lachnospiraceae bacterium]
MRRISVFCWRRRIWSSAAKRSAEKKALLEEKESRIEKLRVEEQLLTGDMEKLEEQTGHEAIRHDLKIQALMREEHETGQKKRSGWQIWMAVLCGVAAVSHLFLFGKYAVAAWCAVEMLFLFFLFFAVFTGRRSIRNR